MEISTSGYDVIRIANFRRSGAAAIQPSKCLLKCLPAATTAASSSGLQSRGMVSESKIVMGARNNTAAKEAKRRIVAQGVRCKTRAIAKAAECGPRHVQKLAAEPATQILNSQMLRPYRAELEAVIPLTLRAIHAALQAQKTDTADHMARLRATQKLFEYLELAQGPRGTRPSGQITWEEFLELYRQRHNDPEAGKDSW